MSQENVELVRRFVEAVERLCRLLASPSFPGDSLRAGEVDPGVDVMRYLHPNIEWKSALSVSPPAVTRAVHECRSVSDAAQDYEQRLEVTDLGDSQVLAVLRLAMKGKASEIDVDATTLDRHRGGRHDHPIGEYLERAEALEAAGVSE